MFKVQIIGAASLVIGKQMCGGRLYLPRELFLRLQRAFVFKLLKYFTKYLIFTVQ